MRSFSTMWRHITVFLSLPFSVFTVTLNCTPATPVCTSDADCTSTGPGSTCIMPATPLGCCSPVSTTTTTTTAAPSVATIAISNASRTTNSTCFDLLNPLTGLSDCPARSFLCKDSVYLEVMQQQCPLTCGFCNNTLSNSTSCVDLLNPLTGVSDCPARAFLCSNSVYLQVMQVQCPLTCGFCRNGTSG